MSNAILRSFSWCGPAIHMLCEADPEFAQHLISQTQAQRQCLVLVVLGWERLGSAIFTPRELAKNVRSQSKKALLKQFIQPYPTGLGAVVKKLGNRVMVRDRYLELIDLLAEPKAAKFLWHEPKVRSSMITALVGLEPAFRRPKIVRNVANKTTLHCAQYAIAVARRVSPKVSDRVLAKSLEGAFPKKKNGNPEPCEAQWKMQEWLVRRLTKATIPKPPWNGSQKLRPITRAQDLLKTAEKLENCLASELVNVIGKKRYFYLWKDRVATVVALENDPLLGWIVGEIKGPHNKDVSKKTKEVITEEFRAAGIEEYQGAQEFNLYD